LLLALVGCRAHHPELLEAELRTLEEEVYQLRGELHSSEAHRDALQRELGAVRTNVGGVPLPEQASQVFPLTKIVLGRGTGGYDEDDCPGDEGIQLQLEPKDPDNHTIKTPGTLYVQALEFTPEGLKQPVSAWEVTPDQLRRKWHEGLLSTGYRVVLPWQNWPTSDKVRVIARLVLADGRAFEAEKDITVRPTAPAKRKPVVPPPGDAPVPRPSDQGIPLPPRKLEPGEQLPPPRKADPAAPPDLHSSWKPSWTQPSWTSPQPVEQASAWQPRKPPPVHTAIELLPPVPLGITPASLFRP
jgi:hypothetical protein